MLSHSLFTLDSEHILVLSSQKFEKGLVIKIFIHWQQGVGTHYLLRHPRLKSVIRLQAWGKFHQRKHLFIQILLNIAFWIINDNIHKIMIFSEIFMINSTSVCCFANTDELQLFLSYSMKSLVVSITYHNEQNAYNLELPTVTVTVI